MRVRVEGPVIACRAIAGTYVVVLAWDFLPGHEDKKAGLMGFAIERTELGAGGPSERYWLRGIKRFRTKDEGLAPGSLVPTADHPVQAFQWGDYTAKAGTTYRYRIVPTYGKPKLLKLDFDSATEIEITAEPETGQIPQAEGGPRHDIYFNRGVIGSQAYARKFKNREPDPNNPESEEMKWLSRGLYEGLQKFIRLGARDRFGLRAALYEFHYQPIANAFARAIEAGGDVKIVFDAESSYKEGNLETIRIAGLDTAQAVIPRTVSEGIRHNKFIVLLEGDEPIAVWTGSTNISVGGIFGHSNAGHIVWDKDVAEAYLEYWKRLADNLTPTKLRAPNRKASPTPKGEPPKGSIIPLFSPRDAKDSIETLQWYADRMAAAKEVICFTVAFNLDEVFQKVIAVDNDVLRYIVKDDDLGDGEIIGKDRDVIFAAGAYFGEGVLDNFIRERDNPLNTNNYIHTKFMLVDPLSDDPIVVTGSANFSRPSQRINDENMLIIRGDTRVADIYFGEYMRVFDHHYARYIVRKLQGEDRGDPDAGYLKEETKDWLPPHFNAQSYKARRRRYFVGT
jgi:phosphatidylserine/phosphatidylglycerophosphate/cardiolipin synthase-like enzyme